MKKILALITVLAISSVLNVPAQATDDPKYPGYDFAPEVVFRSPELIENLKNEKEQPPTDPDYPSAYFTPVVVYQDKELIKKGFNETTTAPDRTAATKISKNKPFKDTSPAPTKTTELRTPVDTGSFPAGPLGLTIVLIIAMFLMMRQDRSPALVGAAPEENTSLETEEMDESESEDSDHE